MEKTKRNREDGDGEKDDAVRQVEGNCDLLSKKQRLENRLSESLTETSGFHISCSLDEITAVTSPDARSNKLFIYFDRMRVVFCFVIFFSLGTVLS